MAPPGRRRLRPRAAAARLDGSAGRSPRQPRPALARSITSSSRSNERRTSVSGTRSCGRRGPARLGTTAPRSSSTERAVLRPPGSTSSWKRPCSFMNASIRAMCSGARPVRRRYWSVAASTGKKPQVAPYSGAMLAMVARSATDSDCRPGPWNSTNLPTTPCSRSRCVTVSTRSVAVVPLGIAPVRRKPTTSGTSIEIGWPSIAASASMPPTPQPRTPSPLIMVVCESVPTSVSG